MPNFHVYAQDLYSKVYDKADRFVFPVFGLKIETDAQYEFGPITIMGKEAFLRQLDKGKRIKFRWGNRAIAEVQIPADLLEITPEGQRHRTALNLLRELIGSFHVFAYKLDPSREKKITISKSTDAEVEEGLSPFYASWGTIDYLYYSNDFSFSLDLASVLHFTEEGIWNDLFDAVDKRNEYQTKICKLLEISYYSTNNIHAYNRMNDWFIALNYAFRSSDSQDIRRTYLARKLNVIFSNILQEEIFDKKFTKGFEHLYEKVRNNILHGILPVDELSTVDESDFKALRFIFYNLIIFMVEDERVNANHSINEFVAYLTQYRP